MLPPMYPIIALSPSKTLRTPAQAASLLAAGTAPGLEAATELHPGQKAISAELRRSLCSLSADRLAEYYRVSDKLAESIGNLYNKLPEALPAWTWYSGEAFKYLNLPHVLAGPSAQTAAKSLLILSALYGPIGPMLPIQPYRLDLTLALPPGFRNPDQNEGRSLAAMWRPVVSEVLRLRIESNEATLLVDCASEEFSALLPGASEITIPKLKIEFVQAHPKTGKPARIPPRTKQARGAFAGWLCRNLRPGMEADAVAALCGEFSELGYRQVEHNAGRAGSREGRLVFSQA